MGYQFAHVIATKEKVVLDSEVADKLPTTAAFILLLCE